MRISPIHEEILEKLYTKAFVTEKSVKSKEKYTEFIDNTIKIDEYNEIKSGILRTYLSYWFLSFVCLVVYFWDSVFFVEPTFDEKMNILYIFGLSCGISLVLGYFRNRRSRRFLKWMKPYLENKILEQFHKYEENLKKREQYRAQKDQELRDKYLTEHSTNPESYPKIENSVLQVAAPQTWEEHAYPLQLITIELQGTRHSEREHILSQLQEIEERIKSGDEHGEKSDDDFGYKFTLSSPAKSLFS